jgi:ABC-type Fe3+/spermidine/putrescine transport system ATPase subunit
MSVGIHLDRVSAGYGGGFVLRDLSLVIEPGSLTALVGPSGCGKTTALKVIAGLLAPIAGDVWFGEQRVTAIAAEKRGIAMVFQKPLLFPHMSVGENVAFGLAMRGMPQAQRRAAAEDALRMVQLDGFADRRPKELSGGQEQRATLARALITQPRVLLLDEPLSALDEGLRAEMRGLVRALQRRLAISTIFVTHDQREATEVADQIAVLLDGHVVQTGPPRVFYTDPASEAVARFFGWCVIDPPAWAAQGAAVAFHPSVARLCSDEPNTHVPGSFPVVIEHVADLGTELRLSVRFQSGSRLDLVQSASAIAAPVPVAGATARLVVPQSALRAFPVRPRPDRESP